MKRFIEGQDRGQGSLLPEHLDDYVAEDNPVRVVDVFVDELDLAGSASERYSLRKRDGRHTTRPYSSSSTFMATSTASSRAAGSSAKPSATSS